MSFLCYLCLFLYSDISHTFCFLFLFFFVLSTLMLEVSLDCPFLIAPSIFSNVYLKYSCVYFFLHLKLSYFLYRNSYRSSGSSPQPGGQRELPAPPISSSRETPGDEEEDADYDHLTMGGNNGGKRSSRYDHVTLTPEGNVQVEEHKTKGEPFYSEVNSKSVKDIEKTDLPSAEYIDDDADYATVNNGSDGSIVDVKRISVVKIKTVEDPYSELKDEVSGGSFMDIDPYSKVRGDLESDSGQSFNPYSKVKDDPYSMVREDDPYNKVDGDVDWLPNSPTDDPYNKVDESNMEGSSSGTSRVIDAYASVEPKSTRNNQITRINESQKTNVSHKGEAFCIVEESANEYAVVMKSRSDTTPTPTLQNQFNFQSQDNDDHSSLPQEPPRRYNEYAEPDDSLIGSGSSLIQISSQRSSVVQSSSQRSSLVQNGGDISSPEQPINSNIGAAGISINRFIVLVVSWADIKGQKLQLSRGEGRDPIN